jgi:hypothetical protein
VLQDKHDIGYVHVDQNDTQRPDIGSTGPIYGSHVVSALCEAKHRDKAWEKATGE